MRDVAKVLQLRYDISPFLMHLTRDTNGRSARRNLRSILRSMTLKYGTKPISDAKFRFSIYDLDNEKKLAYFSAVSFTETPLGEIHNLLEIGGRRIDLKPYGLVFLKERLKKKGVSPVIYINNMKGDKDKMVEALCSLIETHKRQASRILPLIAVFGKFLSPLGGSAQDREIDFTWEREWRYASRNRCFGFDQRDVFIGLCPDQEIGKFESQFGWVHFIDPRQNMKWYAESLLNAKKRSRLKYAVI
jgi:hypothetical protein